jgi:hypothetical protein
MSGTVNVVMMGGVGGEKKGGRLVGCKIRSNCASLTMVGTKPTVFPCLLCSRE